MTKKITTDLLASEIINNLKEYVEVTEKSLKKAVIDVSKEVKEEIVESAPKKSGRYKKSWKVTKKRETTNSIETVIHSKNRYQLTHLLEFGHAKKNGGRTKALVHIEPATRNLDEKVTKKIERDLI